MSTNLQGRLCHLIVSSTYEDQFDEKNLKNMLRSDDVNSKKAAMKTIIRCLSSGVSMPSLFLEVINHVSKNKDHYLKKLWFLFWEMMPKVDANGEPLPEVILACDSFLKDLLHPNEYLRGSVLRFMSKMREPVVLQAIFNYVIEGLNHREPYVRRNAVLAIFSIHKNFPNIIDNVPKVIVNYLEKESSLPCRRNAFIALLHIDLNMATEYIIRRIDSVNAFGDTMQLIVVELIVKVCRKDQHLRSRFIRCVYSLLNSESPAVRFEAANTLILLTSLPAALKQVVNCYVDLVSAENDVNVSLVILGRLGELIKSSPCAKSVLVDSAGEILRMLGCDDLSVRRQVLKFVAKLISQKNISRVTASLKNEFLRCSSDKTEEINDKYKQLLILAFKTCSLRFPETLELILPTLTDHLLISSESVSKAILEFVRANFAVSENRGLLINNLFSVFSHIHYPSSVDIATWLVCEFSFSVDEIKTGFNLIRTLFDEIVSIYSDAGRSCDMSSKSHQEKISHVLKDGSYVTQSALASSKTAQESIVRSSILAYLETDNMLTVASICSSLSKLCKKVEVTDLPENIKNNMNSEALFMMTCILCFLENSIKLVSQSEIERIESAIVLLLYSPITHDLFNQFSNSFAISASSCKDELFGGDKKDLSVERTCIDHGIPFRFLSSSTTERAPMDAQINESFNEPFSVKKDSLITNQSSCVFQLTGMADVVYAEAQMEINHYTIWLDVSVVNQTEDTLQNFSLELAVIGDMTVINHPQSSKLGPRSCLNISTSVRMSSLQNGVIFGCLVYDTRGALNDRCYVVLNDIRIDIVDYIKPSYCSDDEFRRMWSDFEWENKIMVDTNITDLRELLQHMLEVTKMRCLTCDSLLNYDLGFISANFYSKSIFGDSILANLSVESNQFSGEINGHVRIRSMTQAVAISIGELINTKQRK